MCFRYLFKVLQWKKYLYLSKFCASKLSTKAARARLFFKSWKNKYLITSYTEFVIFVCLIFSFGRKLGMCTFKVSLLSKQMITVLLGTDKQWSRKANTMSSLHVVLDCTTACKQHRKSSCEYPGIYIRNTDCLYNKMPTLPYISTIRRADLFLIFI